MYMVVINNNFTADNRYVISEQCCSVSVSNQLKLLGEIMKKYQLDNKIYGNRSLIIFRQ